MNTVIRLFSFVFLTIAYTIDVYADGKYVIFVDSRFHDAMDEAWKLSDTNHNYEAYQLLRNLRNDAEDAIKASGQDAATMENAEDFRFYINVMNSYAECAYSMGLRKDVLATRQVVCNHINKRLRKNLCTMEEYSSQIAAFYKSLADDFYLYSEGDIRYLNVALENYGLAQHYWHEAGDVEDSLLVNIDIAQLAYETKKYEMAKEHLEMAEDGLMRRYVGTNGNISFAEEKRQYDLEMLQSAISLCNARLGDFSSISELDRQIKSLPKKDTRVQELKRRKAKAMMLKYYNDGLFNPEVVNIYKEYFNTSKKDVRNLFVRMSANLREQYWIQHRAFMADCMQLEDKAPDFLYDVVLFNKGILLNTSKSFDMLLTENEKKILLQKQEADIKASKSGKQAREAENYEEKLMKQMESDGRMKGFMSGMDYTWKDVQKALPSNGCAVEFIEYEKNKDLFYGALILKKTGSPKFVNMYNTEVVGNYYPQGQKKPLSELMTSKDGETYDTIYTDQALKTIIWDKISIDLAGCEKVYFAADGIFNRLAIEYIVPEALANKRFYRLSSTRVLAEGRKPDAQKLREGAMFVLGGIVYESSEKRSVSDANRGNDIIAYDFLRPTTEPVHVNYLKGARIECDSIVAWRNNPLDLYLKEQNATETAFYENCNKYPLLHISTHGGFMGTMAGVNDLKAAYDANILSYSTLALSNMADNLNNPNFDASNKDGILSAKEIASTDMSNVELVSTSACQTALGNITADGVYGIQRGFKSAGVKGMILSLWSVSDDSATYFFQILYKNLKDGLSIYDSFYKARAELATKSRTSYSLFIDDEGGLGICKKDIFFNTPMHCDPYIMIDIWE